MTRTTFERLPLLAALLCGTALMAPQLAFAQDTASDDATEVEAVEVLASGSRLPANVTSVPGTVTVVSERQIDLQSAISTDLGRILQQTVPGLAPSSGDGNNFAQTIRGRKPSFFIDGIPQSAELRGGGRDLRIIHPNVLERIEVINGATSIYGLGGSGGVVNYITKRPRDEGVRWYTEVSGTAGFTNFDSEGLEYGVTQGVAGLFGPIDFTGSFTFQHRGLFYDGDGDPIPTDPAGQTGIADMNEINVFGKVGWQISDRMRWETMVTYYDARVDTDYTVKQGSFRNGVKSIAEKKRQNNFLVQGLAFDFIGAEDPSSYNGLGTTSLLVEDLFAGTSAKLQAYYKQSQFTWRHLDFLALAPTQGGFPPNGSQLRTTDWRWGARLDFNTPVKFAWLDGFLLWGFEASRNTTQEKLVDGRQRTSKITNDNQAAFVQLQADITPRLHLRTGLRADAFQLNVPSFQSIDYFPNGPLHPVTGAGLDYSAVTKNLGLVYDVTDHFSVFGSYSDGFSIGNVVRTISGLRPNTNTGGVPVPYNIAALGNFTEPVQVKSWEYGLRANFPRFKGQITLYENSSKLGATFDPITLATVRAPERITGLEISGEAKVRDDIRIGASYAKAKGKIDTNNDGKWNGPLDFARIPPPILNAYVEVDLPYEWTSRLQSATVFGEERFRQATFGQSQRHIKGYTVWDFFVSGPAGPGTLSFGVENVFNNTYRSMITYMNCADNVLFDAFCNTYAPGARGTLKYSIKY